MATQQIGKENENIELEEVIMHNMIEEFMNISDEDNKIFNTFKTEFSDLAVLQYGSLMYIKMIKILRIILIYLNYYKFMKKFLQI